MSAASPKLCAPRYWRETLVSLACSSLFIPSCKARGLLTTCGSQLDAVGLPTGRAHQHDQALPLQTTEPVTDMTLGTRQRCHQRRVTTCDHPTGPLFLSRQPPQNLPLESGETPGSHHHAPDSSVERRVSAGAAATGAAPACGQAWRGLVRTPCTAAWTAGSAKSGHWMSHGAWGPTWRAGKGPWARHRLTTVALTPHGRAAWVSVSQACPWAKFGSRE
jgi:hypothetical protein